MSKFSTKLALLVVGLGASVEAASLPPLVADVNMVKVLGTTNLDKGAFTAFKNCVSSVNAAYRAHVEEDTFFILAPTQRSIDIDAEDAAIGQCLIAASTTFNVAMQSTEDKAVYDSCKLLADISFQDAVAMGAKSLMVVAQRAPTASMPTESPRDAGPANELNTRACKRQNSLRYYDMATDIDPGCEGSWRNCHLNQCYSVGSKYLSIQAANDDPNWGMFFKIWPHHSCSKGDSKLFYISAGYTIPCQNRTVYSWKAWRANC